MNEDKMIKIIGGIVISLFLFWILGVNHVNINEIGIAYNSVDGNIFYQKVGYHLTAPWVRVRAISTTPFRVELSSQYSGAKVINQKIVRIRPEGLNDLIALEGFSYSLGFVDRMRDYAYSGNQYSFLEIIQESNLNSFSQTNNNQLVEQ